MKIKTKRGPRGYYNFSKQSKMRFGMALMRPEFGDGGKKLTRKDYFKIAMIYLKREAGGKCSKCGYDKCSWALDFHHINKKEKLGTIQWFITSKSIKLAEIESRKCILLCANCHREHHYLDGKT